LTGNGDGGKPASTSTSAPLASSALTRYRGTWIIPRSMHAQATLVSGPVPRLATSAEDERDDSLVSGDNNHCSR
jgi:hypothetical protein